MSGSELISLFMYADDVVLASKSGLARAATTFEEMTQRWGLEINVPK